MGGTEISKKTTLVKRLKAASSILIPLVMSSVERIETIANAMGLRGFGKNEKRTWYMSRKFRKMDIISIAACVPRAAMCAFTLRGLCAHW